MSGGAANNNSWSPSRIIFGSCNSQHFEQPFWDVILDRDPTAFVWAGDAVYADDRRSPGDGRILDATPDYLRQLFDEQRRVPGYQTLIDKEKSGVSIFGTIDDHDYGTNNGDQSFEWRHENGVEFVRFLGLDESMSAMARRASNGKGVYGVQVYDFSRHPKVQRPLSDLEAALDPDVVSTEQWKSAQESEDNDRHVAVFVLDVRTNKTPWSKRIPERYSMYPKGDFLGEEQWEWFEEAIGRSKASLNIVVTGLQVHAPWFYDGNLVENWSAFPMAQHRLYQAILQPNVKAPLLVSGDIHLAQLLRKDCRQQTIQTSQTSALRPIHEITTSGMTHSWGSVSSSVCGRRNIGRLCDFYPYNAFFGAVMTFAHWISPWTALLKDSRTNALQYSLARNVAEVDIDWDKELVRVSILGDEGQTLLRQNWSLETLGRSNKRVESFLGESSFKTAQSRLESAIQSTISEEDFVCVDYRGNLDPVNFAFSIASVIGFALMLSLYPFLVCVAICVAFRRLRSSRRHGSQKVLRRTNCKND